MNLWLDLALAYAKARWCWDDAVFIQELLDECDEAERPDIVIDRLAARFDLDDPMAPWVDLAQLDVVNELRHRMNRLDTRGVN